MVCKECKEWGGMKSNLLLTNMSGAEGKLNHKSHVSQSQLVSCKLQSNLQALGDHSVYVVELKNER